MRTASIGILSVLQGALAGCQRESAPVAQEVQQRPTPGLDQSDRGSLDRSLPAEVAKAEPDSSAPVAKSRLRTDLWDFGIVSPGTELRHRYTITNDSTTTWTIRNVVPSCSCTPGEFSSRKIKPAET